MRKVGFRTKEQARQESLPTIQEAAQSEEITRVDGLFAKRVALSAIVEEARKIAVDYVMNQGFRCSISKELAHLAFTYDRLIKK